MKRRSIITAAFGSLLTGISYAQAFPSKPMRLIVPFPAGGATDVTARVIAEPLSRLLGQAVIVDNKGGAGGSIGMMELAKSSNDGYTMGMATLSTHGVNSAVYKKLPRGFKSIDDRLRRLENAALRVHRDHKEAIAILNAVAGNGTKKRKAFPSAKRKRRPRT